MTDDLTTLLRDAGREPTIDLDVEGIQTRGRHRMLVRRVATGAGVLVLLGVLGVGLATLVDQPDAPVVDQAPADDTAPATPGPSPARSEEEATTTSSADLAADQALADELGVATVRIVDDGNGPDIVRAGFGPAPSISQYGTSTEVPLWGATVGGDGSVWFTNAEEDLLVLPSDPDRPYDGSSMADVVRPADPGVSTWRVLGPDGRGGVLVGNLVSDPTSGESFALHRARGTVLDGVEPGFEDVMGAIDGDGTPFAAAAAPDTPEEVVAVDAIGESYGLTVLRAGAGGETRFVVGGTDHWLGEVAVAGRDVLVLESGSDRVVDLLVHGLDDDGVRRVATPIGHDHDGHALELSTAVGEDGTTWVALSAGSDGEHEGASWIADAAALAAAAEPSDVMVPGPDLVDDLWEPTGLPGHLSLLPRPADDAGGALAACATEADGAYVNARPLQEQTVLYYLCWDAVAQLPEGVAHPFVPTERPLGPVDQVDATGLLALLRTWAEGPTAEEADAGLEGGLDPEVATIADVTIDGSTATVDLSSGEQVGVLGTTTGGATFTMAVVGTVLQFEELDEVVITLDGACEDWAALGATEPEECPVHDESHTPWGQGSAAVVR